MTRVLVVFAGLPGTGKSTVAQIVARRLGAAYLRIDAIEVALREAGEGPDAVGARGYRVAHAVARSNLRVGRPVVADAVNAVAEARAAWRALAREEGVDLVEAELVCSDPAEHRRRVETRRSDLPGLVLPDWDAVARRVYEPWDGDRLVLDTATLSATRAAEAVLDAVEAAGTRVPA